MAKTKKRLRKRVRGAAAVAAPIIIAGMIRKHDRARDDGEAPMLCDPEVGCEEVMIESQDGTPLFLRISGRGDRTLFFVHGWTCNGTVFRFQRSHFEKDFRVVTLDLRGHGRSGIPESLDYHPERLAEDLKAAVDYVDPGDFLIAGHSMGGFTTFKFYELFGEEYKGRLKGLAIIDSTGTDLVEGLVLGKLVGRIYPAPLRSLLEFLGTNNRVSEAVKGSLRNTSPAYMLVRWAAFGKEPRGYQVEFMREMIFDTPVTTISLAAKGCLDFHYDYYLPDVRVPVMLLVGDRDKLTDLPCNQRTAELLPDASMAVFADAGHCSLMERRREFNSELEGFLERVIPAGAE